MKRVDLEEWGMDDLEIVGEPGRNEQQLKGNSCLKHEQRHVS